MVHDLRLLGVLENIFDERGTLYHEICFVYEGWVPARELDRLDGTKVIDLPVDDEEVARVFDVASLVDVRAPLYPEGVARLLIEKPHEN